MLFFINKILYYYNIILLFYYFKKKKNEKDLFLKKLCGPQKEVFQVWSFTLQTKISIFFIK
jgi:hypothetical protein